jgi:uncharacterized protein YfbU (UPF0304 family)
MAKRIPIAVWHEVISVLTMYDQLNSDFQRLPDKTGVDPAQMKYQLKFNGFDGNKDFDHMDCVDLLSDLVRFQSISISKQMNSGTSTSLPMYRKMLAVWHPLQKSQLNESDIQAILATQIARRN